MNPKVVKLRDEREKNVAKIASLQERNKKIDHKRAYKPFLARSPCG